MSERDEISQEISDKVNGQIETERLKRKRGTWFWVVMVAYMIVGPAAAIAVSSNNTRQSERKLCTIVVSVDEGYRRNPPTSPPGKQQAENFHKLRRDLGCPPYQGDGK